MKVRRPPPRKRPPPPKRRPPVRPPGGSARPPARRGNLPQVLHDLQVHQEELRQQNDELRRTQLALEEARDRYYDLFDVAPLPYLTLRRNGSIAEANDTCQAFLGRPFDKLVEVAFAALLLPAWRPVFRQFLSAQRKRFVPAVLHLRMFAAAGEVPVELHVRSGDGQIFYLALVDLGERERMALERQALLVDAEVARAATAASERFLAGLSHELRTPLTPVVAAVSGLEPRLAEGTLPPEELRALLAMIRRNLDYEVRLIDDLLDASRLAFGKLVLERQNLDLHAAIVEAVAVVAPEAERKRLAVTTELAARPHHVDGDGLRLRQVFWNLLRNAVKFTPPGGSVTVRSHAAEGVLSVEVQDSGVGIAAVDLPRVFDRFVQTETGAHAGGLGLGLTIAQGIVEAHGGQIRAESAGPGKGARFSVRLAAVPPFPEIAADAVAEASALPPPTPSPPVTLGPPRLAATGRPKRLHILLVDDHEETAEILGQLLRREGFQVTIAHTMAAALTVLPEDLDLLVTDVGLPDGSGLELMKRLRPHLRAPAIALTGYGRQEDIERSRAAGFSRHLVKPVAFPALLRAIRELADPV